jgi:hypothetical protein
MALFSFLKSYNPSIEISDGVVAEFDAEFDMSLLTRTKITSYPVESGQEISGSIILLPAELKLSWGIGVRKLTPLLSTDFVDNLQSNSVGLIGGLASNIVKSGIGNFLIGTLASTTIQGDSEESRAFKAISIMQDAQINGVTLNPVIEGIGRCNNMLISELRMTRGGKDGGKVMFDISMSQIMQYSERNTDDSLSAPAVISNVKGELVE